jgi:hypothetical protein
LRITTVLRWYVTSKPLVRGWFRPSGAKTVRHLIPGAAFWAFPPGYFSFGSSGSHGRSSPPSAKIVEPAADLAVSAANAPLLLSAQFF